MLEFDKRLGYFREILTTEDCVTIPGVGGFIVNYQPARFDDGFRKLLPPWKSVAFNNRLQTNDGILADFIAKKELTSTHQANIEVRNFSKQVAMKLKEGKVLNFSGIGELKFENGTIPQFKPVQKPEICDSSFGLKNLQTHPAFTESLTTVKESNSEKSPIAKAQQQTLSKKPEVEARKAERKSKNRKYAKVLYAFALLIIAGLMYFQVGMENLQLQQLGIIQAPAEKFSVTHTLEQSLLEELKSEIKDIEQIRPAAIESLNEVHKTHVAAAEEGYYIVVGSFKNQNRANRLMNRLNTENQSDQYVILPDESGQFHRVAYFTGGDYDEAENTLFSFRNTLEVSAWLIKNDKNI